MLRGDSCQKISNALLEIDEPLHMVLDFDHTLLLGNSTELFISSGWPYFWALWVDKLANKTAPLAARFRGFERDAWRVLLHLIFLPHSILAWRWGARSVASRRLNIDLWNMARSQGFDKITIVSHGFRCLIKPLVREIQKRYPLGFEPKVLASPVLSVGQTVRRQGKVRVLGATDPAICWRRVIAVSDSEEDIDLLIRARKGILAKWTEPAQDHAPGYFPFLYISQGKYYGRHYLSRFIFGQDLIVWLLMYVSGASDMIPALLFFISFYALYEIGYYENDHIGARNEKQATIWPSKLSFNHYPIYFWGWVVSLLSGFAAVWVLDSELALRNGLLWLSILLTIRAIFYIYNRQDVIARIPLYLALQVLKNFAAFVVMSANVPGLVLGMAHAAQHTSVYLIYRCGGEKKLFKREFFRACVCIVTVSLLILTGYGKWFWSVNGSLCLFWLYYRVLYEKYGRKISVAHRFARASRKLGAGLLGNILAKSKLI